MGLFRNTEQTTENYDVIIEEAGKLFIEKSFDEVTMQEVADKANVSLEKLYKFFVTKRDLLFRVSLSFWSKKYLIDDDIVTDNMSGIEGVQKLVEEEVRIFMTYPERYIFLEKFDNYVKNHLRTSQIVDVKQLEFLDRYQTATMYDETIWKMTLLAGLSDGSIRNDLDMTLVVYSLSTMKIALFQKLANRRVIIDQDNEYTTEEVVSILKKMIIEFLTN